MRYVFYPGRRYIGGAEVPVFVSEDMIRDEAADMGFVEVQIWDADAFQVPFATRGEYDVVAMGTYIGKSPKTIDLADEVRWVWDVSPVQGEGLPVPPPGGPPVMTEPIAQAPAVPERRWWVIGAVMGAFAIAAGGAFALAEKTT